MKVAEKAELSKVAEQLADRTNQGGLLGKQKGVTMERELNGCGLRGVTREQLYHLLL